MKASNNYMRIFTAVVLLLVIRCSVFAGDEHYAAEPLDGSKGQVKKDSTSTVKDTVFFNSGLKPYQTTNSVNNLITFSINEYSQKKLPDVFSVTIQVKIYATRADFMGNPVMDSSLTAFLTINYNKNDHYTRRAAYIFNSAYQSKIKIIDITSNTGTLSDYDSVLMLENEISVNRAYAFNCTTNAVQSLSMDSSDVSASGELSVSWAKERAADEYDLEWTYVDSSAIVSDRTAGVPDPKKIFAFNATRVSITQESYKIPLLYDNKGTLYFRVRSVQVGLDGQRYEAHWSSDYSGGLDSFMYSGHERTLNWQATTSYAEEGKRKSVVQYYDGSLRSRQTVTKDNTTDTTLVAETMYDYQGRPVIQVLPAPSLSRMIQYTPNFTVDINGAEYDKTKYDGPASSFNYCGPGAAAMGSQSGASKYYSPANQNAGNSYNQYIPDAHHYPFTETKYTQDNTGRVSVQGGVDSVFQIGVVDAVYHTTHDTKYFYGSADQEDVDALFGSEAGNANHYFKNMVRDANGQYSVSYVDMHGRTVATALAGKPAMPLDSLESGRLLYETKKLVDSTNNIIKGTVIESSKSLVVTKAGAHVFHYSLRPDSLQLKGCDSSSVCYTCLYNLQITISDDCNNQTLPGGQPIVVVDSNFTIGHIGTTYDTVGFSKLFTDTLQEGTYTITKRLSISKYGMDYYRDSIFVQHNTCSSLTDFINQQKSLLLGQISCAPTCSRCSIDTFSNWTLYRPYYLNQLGIATADTAGYRAQAQLSFNQEREACDEVCGNTSLSVYYRDQMMADVSPPYGQYANPDSVDVYSIFSKTTSGVFQFSGKTYVNESGVKDTIFNADGSWQLPGALSVTDFITNFKPTWADTLLTLHPEYKKLVLYESTPFVSSQLWDDKFEAVDTYKQALDSGYLNPLGYTDAPVSASSTIRDPFFNSSVNPAYASTWRTILNDSMRSKAPKTGGYVDMWSLATSMAQCAGGDTACYNHYSSNTHPFDIDTSCGGTLDMAWRFFREMYINAKRSIVTRIVNQTIDKQTEDDLVKSDHALIFPEPDVLAAKLPATQAVVADSVASMIKSSCEGYAKQWWQDMAPCGYTYNDSIIIVPRLIKVCEEGGDSAHVFGSGTVRPSSTYTYKSFDDVLKAYNDSLATAASPRSISRNVCNGYMLSGPGAYDNVPVSSNVDVWTKPDSCQCSTITALYNQYLGNGKTDGSFSAYLLRTTGTVMSGAALDSLRQLCSGQITCKALAKPISLPPVLQCGVHDVCVSCLQVSTLYTQYTIAFPGSVPAYDNTDSLQRTYNHLFESYMNSHLGFGKQAYEYLTFLDTCQVLHGGATSCDSLQALKSDYIKYNGRIPHLDASGADTTYWKWDDLLGQPRYTIPVPFAATFNNGIVTLPNYYADTVSPVKNYIELSHTGDTLCVDTSGFTFETRIKLPDSLVRTNGFDNTRWWIKVQGDAPAGQILFAVDTIRVAGVVGAASALVPPTAHFNDWRVVKIKMVRRDLYCYIDDTLRAHAVASGPISKIYWWSLGQYSFKASIDYVRIYDTSGHMYFDEEFNDAHNLSYPTELGSCSNCTDRFAAYFNKRKSTSYSFSQIDSIYYQKCGTHVNPCPTTASFRDSLQALESDYLKYNGRIPKRDSTGADTMYNKLDFSGIHYNIGVPFGQAVKNGILHLPDSYTDTLSQHSYFLDHYNDTLCIDTSGFTLETRVKLPDSVSHTDNFSSYFQIWLVPNKAIGFIQTFIVPTVSQIHSTPVGLDSEYAQGGYNVNFNDWRILKLKVANRTAFFYIDDNLVVQRRLMGPIDSIKYWAVQSYSMQSSIDYVRIYDNNGYMYYDEEFNDVKNFGYPTSLTNCQDCTPRFTSYYNKRQGTSYTSAQVDSIYYNTLQYHVFNLVCGTGPTLCGRSEPVYPPATLLQHSPCDDSSFFATTVGTQRYQYYTDSLKTTFNDKYLAKCLNAYKLESFTVVQPMSEFHYTLYYYDQAGNLVKTVPPAGVDMSVYSRSTYFDSVTTARKNGTVYVPHHTLATNYRYNALNQVVAQQTPDAGTSHFWYDRLGRLVVSQNARQVAVSSTESNRQYSYTKYDYLGRINEVGQVKNLSGGAVAMTDSISRHQQVLTQWVDTTLYARNEQVTRTYYDMPYAGSDVIPLEQSNLRNRVSYTTYTNNSHPTAYNQATLYSYDIHGNVDTLLQDYGNSSGTSDVWNIMNKNGNRWKRISYNYDLISGKVNMVSYQPRYWDAATTQYIRPSDCFYHRYSYDAENRLTLVETSGDSVLWEKDARYIYYKHGPLARTVLGDQQVQGMDYAYTLQGWLKGVNSGRLNAAYDMGMDGTVGGQQQYVARDIFSYNLNYFTGDYFAINTSLNPFPGVSAFLNSTARPLYNGNISSMAVNIGAFAQPVLYNYGYDQLNRLKSVDTWQDSAAHRSDWQGLVYSPAYKERFRYDGNGNILHADRYSASPTFPIDSMDYHYTSGTNKLTHISEASSSYSWNEGTKDIEDQPVNNYGYDAIGNLIRDSSENMGTDSIKWNVYGKITSVSRSAASTNSNTRRIEYTYDAAGNRIGKKTTYFSSPHVDYTWYVRDAQGNVLNVYSASKDTSGGTALADFDLLLQESILYGSSRLGLRWQNVYAEPPSAWGAYYDYSRGYKYYELANHLGNVVTVISDKKLGVLDSSSSLIRYAYYNPELVMANDYYAFGMERLHYDAGIYYYRYSFNGQENDRELKGEGDAMSAEFWEYDPRIGRRGNLDPKPTVGISEYSTFNNNPIFNSDPKGDTTIKGAGFWRNVWEGMKDGGKETGGFIKGLGTGQGWKNLGSGLWNMLRTDPGGGPGQIANQIVIATVNAPNMTKDDAGHATGYVTEKVVETVVVSKGTSMIKNTLTATETATALRATTQAEVTVNIVTKTATELSVEDKLARYLLNPEHAGGGATKAKWFEKALGYTKDNLSDLAKQIKFDPVKAVKTEITEFGTKYNQIISITGSNGKIIDVTFAWIKGKDNVVRLVTAIPGK